MNDPHIRNHSEVSSALPVTTPSPEQVDVVIRLKDAFDASAVCHCGSGVGNCDNHDFRWMEDDDTRMLSDARFEIERLRSALAEAVRAERAKVADRIEQAARLLRLWATDRQRTYGCWTEQEQAAVECAIDLEKYAKEAK